MQSNMIYTPIVYLGYTSFFFSTEAPFSHYIPYKVYVTIKNIRTYYFRPDKIDKVVTKRTGHSLKTVGGWIFDICNI